MSATKLTKTPTRSGDLNEIGNWYKCPASANTPAVWRGGLVWWSSYPYTELLTSSKSDNTGVQEASYNSTTLNNDN